MYFWQPSLLDLLVAVVLAVVLGWWAVSDSKRRRHPIPMLAGPWFVLLAGLLVPAYVIWSRRWRGLGLLLLHMAGWYLLALVAMHAGGTVLFGAEWWQE
jgi:hypothetical protein